MKENTISRIKYETFREYGSLVDNEGRENNYNSAEFSYWGDLCHAKFGDTTSIGILMAKRRERVIKGLERHMRTSEILVALDGNVIMLFGKPDWDTHDLGELQSFYLKQGDTIVMNAGTWHSIALPVEKEVVRLLVIFAAGTESGDLELLDLPEPFNIK